MASVDASKVDPRAAQPGTAEPPGEAESALRPRLQVIVVTGDHAVYDGLADVVIAPAVSGQIAVLANHAPLLAALDAGELIVRSGDEEEDLAVSGGFIEVRENRVIVLADTAERAEEIDVARAEAARRRARLLAQLPQGRPESAAARQALRRSRARLRAASRIRRPSPSQR